MYKYEKTLKTRPVIFFFLEGESEELYIKNFKPKGLGKKFTRLKQTKQEVIKYLDNQNFDETKDKVIFITDCDVEEDKEKFELLINSLSDYTENILHIQSNPCFELWYLLHLQDCKKTR